MDCEALWSSGQWLGLSYCLTQLSGQMCRCSEESSTSCTDALNTDFAAEAFAAGEHSFLPNCLVPGSTEHCCSTTPGTSAAARTYLSCFLFEHTDLSARKRLGCCSLVQHCSFGQSSRKCLVWLESCSTACLATAPFVWEVHFPRRRC